MLTPLDDYLVHQYPTTVDRVFTSDGTKRDSSA